MHRVSGAQLFRQRLIGVLPKAAAELQLATRLIRERAHSENLHQILDCFFRR